MSFLRTDYSEVNTGFAPLPVGDYECIVSKAEVTTTSTNKPMLKVTLTVREDVEQEGQKRKFFDNLVQQENMMWKFQQVAKAARIPAGKDIADLADFANEIQFQPVVIRNKHETYNGELQDRVGYWKPSEQEGNGSGDGGIDISDDDLPF